MHNLKEPKENGGSQAQQDKAIAILQEAATVDNRPLVRLAAVQALNRFKDPRVGPILVAAYHNAGREAKAAGDDKHDIAAVVALSGVKTAFSNFTLETINNLQCRSLESLGDHRNPDALQLLVQVAGLPEESKPKADGVQQAGLFDMEVGTGMDRHEVRLAAIRALGGYHGDPTAIRTLIGVLKVDKDVAVRGRAWQALCKITDQDLPPDANAWQAWLDKSGKK
jgi:HEAT repeat protein